jgi:hypothetical protein
MSDSERGSKLLLRAEALVAVAPLKEPNWDSFAARIESALAKGGPTDDSLLLPPLPESVEDGVGGAAVAVREVAPADTDADEPGSQREGALAELARAAVARRGAKEAVSLAKESLAIAAQERGAKEPVTIVEPTIAVIAPTIETERDRSTKPPVGRSRSFDSRGPWIGVAVAAVGLAAGFGLYVSGQRQTQIVQLPAAEVAKAPAPPIPPAVNAEGSRPATPAVTPDMLPAERVAQTAPAPTPLSAEDLAPTGALGKAGAGVAPGERTTASTASGSAAKPERVVLEEEPATKSPVTPVKPSSPAGMRPAEFNANGGVTDRPSTGAAQAAVGAVLGAARSCLAGQPQASSATIQFRSSGEVSSVNVGGPAQGTPAAGCIQSALGKARVQPFAAPSFSLAVTIRPP